MDLNGASVESLGLGELVTAMLVQVLPPVVHFMENGDEDNVDNNI
jgi:hypothetical protein